MEIRHEWAKNSQGEYYGELSSEQLINYTSAFPRKLPTSTLVEINKLFSRL
jgi:hypothetical protein